MHRIQAWDKESCSKEPIFEAYNVSNQCVNLRDGNSVYFDCTTAHLPPLFELNAAKQFANSGKAIHLICLLIMWLVL